MPSPTAKSPYRPTRASSSDEKPHFIGVSEILRRSAERTKHLLGTELRDPPRRSSNEEWHMASLERIFIENKIYQAIEGKNIARRGLRSGRTKRLAPFARNCCAAK